MNTATSKATVFFLKFLPAHIYIQIYKNLHNQNSSLFKNIVRTDKCEI